MPLCCGLRHAPVLRSQTCPCAAVSDMPLCCGLRHAPLLRSQTCPCAAVSDMPLCCGLRHAPLLRSQTCPCAAVSDMPLCCGLRHAPVLRSQTCPCAAVSDMPLCCGLRHAPLVLAQTSPCAAVSDLPLCCGLRHAPVLRSQTCPFGVAGFFTPFVYMTDNAVKLGFPRMQATLLLSVLGGANTLGRVFCGFVSDQSWADCLLIHNLALVVAGGATCLVPLLHSFPLLVVYCVVFGLCIGKSALGLCMGKLVGIRSVYG